jgi:hypothetical protein
MFTKVDVVLMVAADGGKKGQVTVTLQFQDLLYARDNPKSIFNMSNTTLRMRGAEPGVSTADGKEYDGWFITNRRYGHGVGLSQRGAQQRATEGQSYTDIVSFYYADTLVCTMGDYETAPRLKSKKYTVSKSFISGIAPDTSAAEVLSNITAASGTITVVSSAGKQKTEGNAGTGNFIRTVYNNGASIFDLPLLIYGDLSGDGKITDKDLDSLRQHLMNTKKLTGAFLLAADVNRDKAVDCHDVLLLMKHIQGVSTIKQGG